MGVHGDFKNATIYLVGGFVRDHFMGKIPKDKDYVVVGSSPEEMLSLGFKQVGKDFPVFLHPETGDEYALARTDRKTGTGYEGFTCEWDGVTLEEDLRRRDLTINAIAWDCSRNLGKVYDPFNGRGDIKNKMLRPVSDAFKEDPLRCLRAARFMAQFPNFTAAGSLYKYCEELEYEVCNTLTPERVWLETVKAMFTEQPSNYFLWLSMFGLFPEYIALTHCPQRVDHHPEYWVGTHTDMVMDYAATTWNDPEIVFACLTHDFGKPLCWGKFENAHGHEKEGLPFIEDFCDRYKVPNSYRVLALQTCEYHTKVHGLFGRNNQAWTRPKSIMKLFEDTGAMKHPERFKKMLKACEADAKGRGKVVHEDETKTIQYYLNKPYHQREYLEECLNVILSLDTKIISSKMMEEGKKGTLIGEAIRVARISEIRGVQNIWKQELSDTTSCVEACL
ncbi:tRNA nucleotidyltransferase [Vibrio phage eugene 12A10]|uniref:tRNA nucleotidyltransferase n=1 Tax=Vibrio phage eugene 12A10 TaxID=573172 RepID=UPI00035190EE|nr:tRNA nucleotidyltransferase [Vibrio phage eugene 12A10]AGN51473.1 tRNA nucleotidyltransferase [Vibrio phage eugene 12A10]